MSFMLSNYSKDKYVFTKFSQLGFFELEPHGLDLEQTNHWLPCFVLNSMLTANVPSPDRQWAFSAIRRADAAIREYDLTRQSVAEYFGNLNMPLMAYSRALTHAESCVGYLYQASLMASRLFAAKLFVKNDGSFLDRLNKLHNSSKHADERFENGEFPDDGTLACWLVTGGIECHNSRVTFSEVQQAVCEVYGFAEKLKNLGRNSASPQAAELDKPVEAKA